MKCKKCKKRFGVAGNIRNYKIECPFCHHRYDDEKKQKTNKRRN